MMMVVDYTNVSDWLSIKEFMYTLSVYNMYTSSWQTDKSKNLDISSLALFLLKKKQEAKLNINQLFTVP